MQLSRAPLVLVAALMVALAAACSSADAPPADEPPGGEPPGGEPPGGEPATETPESTESAGPSERPRRTGPAYRSEVRRLTPGERTAMTGVSWRPGCPVPLERLRRVTLSHWDFAGRVRRGVLVVRADVADQVVGIFRRLFRDRFPIRRMRPVDDYEGDDYTSIEADNTSAFNCRPATGSTEWSHHAYGLAIDVNPIENPYVLNGRTIHPASERYLDRARNRPGMLVPGGDAVRAFTDAGWHWGGEWANPVDYQHFSKLPEDADPDGGVYR